MSSYCGYVVKVNKLRPHKNANRLQILKCFGNETCVGLDVMLDDIGIYFPSGLQLSQEFCDNNNLCRKKDENGNNVGGYLDPDKRNIKTISLRGEHSDGIYIVLDSLSYTGVDISSFAPGDKIDVVNGHKICDKYIPKTNHVHTPGPKNKVKVRKVMAPIAPLFAEHADTEQLAYNLDAFKPGDLIEVSLKMHGTSCRTAHLPILKGYKRNIFDILFNREGHPIYDYGYITGTRRTICSDKWNGGFYGSNAFRKPHAEFFEGKLSKGIEVFYEIVGYINENTTIMPTGKNQALGKEFIKQYGDTTTFSYGCKPGESKIYVYRLTYTNEEGDVFEIPPAQMRIMCKEWGVETVPLLWRGIIPEDVENAGEWIKNKAEEYYEGIDPIGKTHIREGVVVRKIDALKFTAYKHKNFEFKVIEGIIHDTAIEPDFEERECLFEQEELN